MLKLRILADWHHYKGIPHIASAGHQQIFIKEITVCFHKQDHQHNHCAGIPFTERVNPTKSRRREI